MIRENRPFVEGIVRAVPELAPMLQQHLADNFNELLSHALVADIEGWAEVEAAAGRTENDGALSRLLDYFETVYRENREPLTDDPPANVIAVSFVEGIPPVGAPGGELRELLGPALSDALEAFGDPDVRPRRP